MAHPMHEALKKRMALHEQIHGPMEGHEGNDAPLPAHKSGPMAGDEMAADHVRDAVESQALTEHQSPASANGHDDRHGMESVEDEADPKDVSDDQELYEKMFQDKLSEHESDVPVEHGRSLASKVKSHVARHILHRGVESKAMPRDHVGSAHLKKQIDRK